MSDPHTPESALAAAEIMQPATRSGLYRLGGYALLFSMVFAVMVWGSVVFLLPQWNVIEVSGGEHTVEELMQLKAELASQVEEKEERRSSLITPIQDDAYTGMKRSRGTLQHLQVHQALMNLIRTFPAGSTTVWIASETIDVEKNSITLTGDIRNTGTRSMTVLAEFLDALQKIPTVTSLSSVPFTRQHSESIGDFSPFTVTLALQ